MVQCDKCGYDEIRPEHKICPMCGELVKNSAHSRPKKPENPNKYDDIEGGSDNDFESQDVLVSPRSNVGHIVQAKVHHSKSEENDSRECDFSSQDVLVSPRSSVGQIFQVREIHVHIDEHLKKPFSEEAYLIYIDDKLMERSLPIKSQAIIRRNRSSRLEVWTPEGAMEIDVQDYTVSRAREDSGRPGHAQFLLENGTFYVTDLESKNGTYHNERRLEPHERYRLIRGDIVRIGCNVQFRVESNPEHITLEHGNSAMVPSSKKQWQLLDTAEFAPGEYKMGSKHIFINKSEENDESREILNLSHILTDGKKFIDNADELNVSSILKTIAPVVEKKLEKLQRSDERYADYTARFEELKSECSQSTGKSKEQIREEFQKIVEELQQKLSECR